MSFKTPEDWLHALSRGRKAHIVPKILALEVLGISRSVLDRRIENEEMGMIAIGERSYLSLSDVQRAHAERRKKVDTLRRKIVEVAKKREVIYYGDIMRSVGLDWSQPPDRKEIGSLLAAVSRQSYASHRASRPIILSALVHRKPPKGRRVSTTGPGFFALVEEMELFDPNAEDEAEALGKFMEDVYELASQRVA